MTSGVLTPEQIVETGHFLLRLQEETGAFPWFPGGQWDAWNHTEALMGLTICGVTARRHGHADAEAFLAGAQSGLEHLRLTQRPDGSWPMEVRDGVVQHDEADTNQCAYPAVGVWHYALATGEHAVLERYWPMISRAIDLVLRAQRPDGSIAWAINSRGGVGDHALLTGNASILQSLWSACAIADRLGINVPGVNDTGNDTRTHISQWRRAGNRLASAVVRGPEGFADRRRYSMDWFYPVLGGALTGRAAREHLDAHWERFVWAGHGVRCVDDHPWVTGGETAELAMALACLPDVPKPPDSSHDANTPTHHARAVLQDIAMLRAPGGGYWTGFVVPDTAYWPQEQTGWTAGAMLLAADALDHLTPAGNFFHAMTWPQEVS